MSTEIDGDAAGVMRRRWMRRAALVAVALAVAVGGWGVLVEPDRLVVRETRLALPDWPPALDGLRIAALSDLHVGSPHVGLAKLRRVVAAVDAARPELVVLLGDYVIRDVLGGRFVPPEETARVLAELHPPLGVFAVLGNHDRWFDGGRVRAAFEAAGIAVLEDDVRDLRRNGAPLALVGLSDLWTRPPDVAGTVARVADGLPIIAMTHNPDVFPALPARVSLLLAGHTHGGQVVLPLLGRPLVPSRYGQRYALGHVVESGRHLFVTTGIGTSLVPIRLGVPPEIAVVTLVRDAGSRTVTAPSPPPRARTDATPPG
jgi:predicted MPP superfamily phosphohydrolase